MRKVLSLLLVLMLLVSAIPAFAEEATEAEAVENVEDVEDTVAPMATNVNVYINEAPPLSWINAVCTDNIIYLPAVAASKLFGIDINIIDFYGSAATILTKGENCAYFFNDSCYAIINSTAQDMEYFTKVINSILYLPCDVFSIFGIEYKLATDEKGLSIYITVPQPKESTNPRAKEYENTVNFRNIKSDTNYLIWVSKGDYSVRLFTKNNGSWQFENEFPCAIGKTSSPTCEGTFKYYEKIVAWKYDKYYVGPVMRFNGGYALHSTLMCYDGTPYDDRVGVKISAGCVRLHQPDIQYLWDTVPLKSTVYVTAE